MRHLDEKKEKETDTGTKHKTKGKRKKKKYFDESLTEEFKSGCGEAGRERVGRSAWELATITVVCFI